MHRIAISSDEKTEFTDALVAYFSENGSDLKLFGALDPSSTETDWPLCSSAAAKAVATGEADFGIVCCWTGTGAVIAANKVKGIRAALCHDTETAKSARIWNHANVLGLSLRSTSIPMMKEIVTAFLSTSTECAEAQTEWNLNQIERVNSL